MNEYNFFKKTGLENVDNNHFIIYEENGNVFYDSSKINKPPKKINVPRGTYYSKSIFRTCEPIKYSFPTMPTPQRILNKPTINIVFAENPNKCTVYHSSGLIVFDNSFRTKPSYIIQFIALHEIGHNFYIDERLADMFAFREMLELGYNISQCGDALFSSLDGAKSLKRKEFASQFVKLIKTV